MENGLHCWALLIGSGAVIACLFKLLIVAKDELARATLAERDRVIEALTAAESQLRSLAADAVEIAFGEANWNRHQEGKPPIDPTPAIVPAISATHNAPADAATDRKALEALVQILRAETGRGPGTSNGGAGSKPAPPPSS